MTTKYATGTKVTIGKSILELGKICEKYGATNFSMLKGDTKTAILFKYNNRLYRFDIDLTKIKIKSSGNEIKDEKACKDEERRRWRVFVITLKSMFECIENEVIASELLLQPFVLLPDNTILGEKVLSQVDLLYENSNMINLLSEHN
jgi:hypothetical protein